MTRDTNQARVDRHLLRLRNGASAVAIADAVMPLDKVSAVEQVLAALITQGLAVSRTDGKHLRYFHATRAPMNFGRCAAAAKPTNPTPVPPPALPAAPAPRVQAPAPTRLTPQVPPKRVRKLKPRADMPQPVTRGPSDIIASDVATFLRDGGKIELLGNGVVSRPLRVIGSEACPVRTALVGRRARGEY